jgi:hypothetical protein
LAGGFAEPVERPNELDLEIVPNARESTLVRNVAATQTRALQLGHDARRALGRHDHVGSTSGDGVDDRVGEGDLEPRGADDDVLAHAREDVRGLGRQPATIGSRWSVQSGNSTICRVSPGIPRAMNTRPNRTASRLGVGPGAR